MVKYWFTADTHFGHSNIIKYCNRPFQTIEEHDSYLIRIWNSRVKPEDVVFHLGDFCFKKLKGKTAQFYLDQLNGKIIVVKGNHDSNNGVKTCIKNMRIHLGGKELLLIHKPEDVGYTDVDLVLCGHVHQHWKFRRFSVDFCNVGVDQWKFMPVTINEILRQYNKWLKTESLERGEKFIKENYANIIDET